MDQKLFSAADRYIEKIDGALDQALQSPELRDVREALAALGKRLGERYSVTLTCLVEVFDQQKGRALPLLNTGLSTSDGAEPFPVSGDSTPHRYIVDGQIQVVPHDRCPRCWGAWDFKWQYRHCPHCDTELGKNCQLLLDSDMCPQCEEGEVTANNPKCPECGFVIDPSLVAWG